MRPITRFALDLCAMLGLALAYIAPWVLFAWIAFLLFHDPFLEALP